MEEGLLIGSESGSSYGAVDEEPVIEAQEIVVSKGRKKKPSGSDTKTQMA
jgi:hypothetical protein